MLNRPQSHYDASTSSSSANAFPFPNKNSSNGTYSGGTENGIETGKGDLPASSSSPPTNVTFYTPAPVLKAPGPETGAHIHPNEIYTDIYSGMIVDLQARFFEKNKRDRLLLQPNSSFKRFLRPPRSYLDNPISSLGLKWMKTITDRSRRAIYCCKWDPNGRRILTGNHEGKITYITANPLKFERHVGISANLKAIRAMVYSYSGEFFFTGTADGEIQYFIRTSSTVKHKLDINRHILQVTGLAISPSDTKLLSSSCDLSMKLWDINTLTFERKFEGHTMDIESCDWHPSKSLVASCSKDSTIKLWDPRMRTSLLETIKSNKYSFRDQFTSSITSGKDIGAGGGGSNQTYALREESYGMYHNLGGNGINNGEGIVKGMDDPYLGGPRGGGEGENLPSGNETAGLVPENQEGLLYTIQGSEYCQIYKVAFHPNGRWFARGGQDSCIKLYDVRNPMKEFAVFRGHRKEITTFTFHPIHEEILVSGDREGYIFYWDIRDPQFGPQGEVFAHHATNVINNPTDDGNRNVWDLAWHPQGHMLASVGHDMTLKVWSRSKPGDAVKLSHGQELNQSTPQQLALQAAQQQKKKDQEGSDKPELKKANLDFKAGLLHDGSHLTNFNVNKKKNASMSNMLGSIQKGEGNAASKFLNDVYKRKKELIQNEETILFQEEKDKEGEFGTEEKSHDYHHDEARKKTLEVTRIRKRNSIDGENTKSDEIDENKRTVKDIYSVGTEGRRGFFNKRNKMDPVTLWTQTLYNFSIPGLDFVRPQDPSFMIMNVGPQITTKSVSTSAESKAQILKEIQQQQQQLKYQQSHYHNNYHQKQEGYGKKFGQGSGSASGGGGSFGYNKSQHYSSMPSGGMSNSYGHNSEMKKSTTGPPASHQRGNKPPPTYRCKICNSNEHYIYDCPQAIEKGSTNAPVPANYVCNICKLKGHWIYDCPEKAKHNSSKYNGY